MASGTENQGVSQHAGASTSKGGSVRKPSGGTVNQGMTGQASEGSRPRVGQPLPGTANVAVTQHGGGSTSATGNGSTPPLHATMQSQLPPSLKSKPTTSKLNLDGQISIVKGGGGAGGG